MSGDGKPGPSVPTPAAAGQERIVQALTGALAAGRPAQSVLLVGRPWVGKRATANHLARWLYCDSGKGPRPCGGCRSCRLVTEETHPDLCVLAAPLRIDAVRELQRRLALAPLEARWHVAVLPDMERASAGAANSLLKTLEEPPPDALLILTAADPASVLPTVRSRCQCFTVRPLSVAACAAALERDLGTAPEEARRLARIGGGRLAWALKAARDPAVMEDRALWLDRLEEAVRGGRAERLALADAWGRQRDPLAAGLELWRGWWRDVLFLQHGLEAAVVNVDRLDALRGTAARVSVAGAVRALRALDGASTRLVGNASPDLTAAVALMELPT